MPSGCCRTPRHMAVVNAVLRDPEATHTLSSFVTLHIAMCCRIYSLASG
jgi:hypothetical protein